MRVARAVVEFVTLRRAESSQSRGLCYRMATTMETQTPIVSVANATFRLPNSASARIIAAGIVIAFLHFASSVVVTLLVAVLLAYFLDPVVTWLEDWHIPRALGAFLIVMFVIGDFRVHRLGAGQQDRQLSPPNWPKFSVPLHKVTTAVEKRLEGIEAHVSEIGPGDNAGAKVAANYGIASVPQCGGVEVERAV